MGDRQELSSSTSLVIDRLMWSVAAFYLICVMFFLLGVIPFISGGNVKIISTKLKNKQKILEKFNCEQAWTTWYNSLNHTNLDHYLPYPDAALDTKSYNQHSATIWPKPFLNFHLFSTISITMYLMINLIKTHD